jgi:predicted permease
MVGLLHDVRYALRQLRKSPGFSITAVLMLALAISVNSTVFSWINGTMLHPIPGARDTRSLVSVMRGAWNTSPAPPLSYLDYRDLRERNHTLAGILAYHHDWLTLTDGAEPQRIYIANVSANYFEVLGVQPVLGRFFLPEEETRPDAVPYVVLGYSLWKSRYESDPAIVGKTIAIARRPVTVIGVAPEGFRGAMPGVRQDLWATLNPLGTSAYRMAHRDAAWLNVVARLRPGVQREQATQDLETIMRQIVAAYPDDHLGVNTITLDPMWRSPFGANIYLSDSLPPLLGIAALVLLLTSVNIATLALVRFVARRRELAIRQSLGAGRMQLTRQMMLEGLLVTTAGGACALLMTAWSSKTLAGLIPPSENSIALNGSMDANVVAVIAAFALFASLICGAFPAWRSSRVEAADVLKDEAASVSSGSHNRHLLSGLVVLQIALSLALLITSGLLMQSLKNANQTSPGFQQARVLTASVGLSISGYSGDEIRAFQRKALDRLRTVQGVQYASITDWVPLDFTRKTNDVYPEGYVPRPHELLEVRRADITADYFQTLGIPVLKGRAFTQNDNENSTRVVILDETAANHYWPRQNPLGRQLHAFGRAYTVVGVVGNTKHHSVTELPEPMLYFSIFQIGGPETVVQVRTAGDPSAMAPAVVRILHQLDGRVPVFDVRPLSETTQIAFVFQRIEALFATVFGILALVLASTGIYGVVAYRTALRTHEIGIRVALGAARRDVLRLVLVQGMRLTMLGLAFGLAIAWVLARFMRGLFYGVSAADPLTAFCVVVLLALIALLACLLPARRALHVDPVTAIRTQ